MIGKGNTARITIAYTGPLVDDGTMDVRDLGPALMALGKLVNDANKILNNDKSTIAVNVNADFQKGSFEIAFECVRTITEQLTSLFAPNITVDELLKYLGLASTLGLPNLVDLIKWGYGKLIKNVKNNNDGTVTITITDSNNVNITVNINVFNTYKNIDIRESYDELLKPTQRDGIESFEVRDYSSGEKKVVQSITKEISKAFEFDASTIEGDTKISVQESDQWVKLLKVDFEDLKWRLQSGEIKYYATFQDESFLNDIEEGRISFTKGDMLQVRLEQTQTVKPDGTIKNDYKVIKVLDIQKRAKEISLPFDDV